MLHDIFKWYFSILWDERAALRAYMQNSSHVTEILTVCQAVKMHFQSWWSYLSEIHNKVKRYSDETVLYWRNH